MKNEIAGMLMMQELGILRCNKHFKTVLKPLGKLYDVQDFLCVPIILSLSKHLGVVWYNFRYRVESFSIWLINLGFWILLRV